MTKKFKWVVQIIYFITFGKVVVNMKVYIV